MTNKANQTTEPKEVTVHELVAAFEGKHVNIIPDDHYGISITMTKATIEYEEDRSELWFVSRDNENRVTGSVCFDESSIESIETDDNNSFTVEFIFDMTGVDISEYKNFEELQRENIK